MSSANRQTFPVSICIGPLWRDRKEALTGMACPPHFSREPGFITNVKLDGENSHPTPDALRPLEPGLPRGHQRRWVDVSRLWDDFDPTRIAYAPRQRNELPPVLREPGRPMRRTPVRQAFPDAAAGAAPGPAQFGRRPAREQVEKTALEWLAAFLGSFASLVLFLPLLTVHAEMRADRVPT